MKLDTISHANIVIICQYNPDKSVTLRMLKIIIIINMMMMMMIMVVIVHIYYLDSV
jgi:hypothetical protein